jgi:hypothetical protein
MSYSLICFFAGLSGLPSAPGGFRPGLSADHFRFCDRKPSNSRLGPAKVPQPVDDLMNMAAPAWCRALTVSTPEFEGLLLLCSVLVVNGRGFASHSPVIVAACNCTQDIDQTYNKYITNILFLYYRYTLHYIKLISCIWTIYAFYLPYINH